MIDDIHGSDIISIMVISVRFTVMIGSMMLIELRVKHLFWLA